jgi:hypothetical protein
MGFFKQGVIPAIPDMPPERTHARAKLIYNLLKIAICMPAAKQAAIMAELKMANHVLHDRVQKYLRELTPAEIAFFKGPRPVCYPDGTLAIYDPVRDNPLLMRVYQGEDPIDAKQIVVPGFELSRLLNQDRVFVGHN